MTTNELLRRGANKLTGQAILSLVLLIGGVSVLASLTLSFLAISFVNSAYGFQIAERAEAVAASGAYDAIMRLTRNKDLCQPSCNYTVPVNNDTATVSITQNSPTSGQVTILSAATVVNRTRNIRVIVSRDQTTGQVVVTNWSQT